MEEPLDDFLSKVAKDRKAYTLPLQARRLAEEFTNTTLGLLFPHFAALGGATTDEVEAEVAWCRRRLEAFLHAQRTPGELAHVISGEFAGDLPRLHRELQLDARATCEADPAAGSIDEVVLAYPGFFALACYRIAHALSQRGVVLLPRLITEFAHRETGIDIHPSAQIGRSLAIDHGTGIVIGETAIIGERVRLYQGVTLGAHSVRKDLAQHKRHPTLEDDVVIYANATILGGDTIIGAGSVIGGNVWLTHSVPAGSVVTHGATVERPRAPDESLLEYNI